MNTAAAVAAHLAGRRSASWQPSLPLATGLLVFLYGVSRGKALLADGDTYWHIAAGQWILEHWSVPTQDPFSHTRLGAPWMAHEWLSELVLAGAHAGGWEMVNVVTAAAFAAALALFARALLRWLEPIHVIAAATMAVLMTAGHLVARPHVLAMPLMMLWIVGLVRARDKDQAPSLWLLPVMIVWANMHGGFTLGIALAAAFATEAVLAAPVGRRISAARGWGIFVGLALLAGLVTPQGPHGLWFTWQVLVEDSFALQRIGEWRSPDFHRFQPLEVWLLGAMALALHQGLKLPPVRLALLLALTHLALKHIRNVELLGLLAPVFLAPAIAAQWRERHAGKQQFEMGDRLLRSLARPAGAGAILAAFAIAAAATVVSATRSPLTPAEEISPAAALRAANQAGASGPVLNDYAWGGYLIYSGVAPFIDGRADVYGDAFMRDYAESLDLTVTGALPALLARHGIGWTMLTPDRPAVAMLDRLPGWRRVYADRFAVVHMKTRHQQDAGAAMGRPEQ